MSGTTLKELRLYIGITQQELADRVGVSKAYISLMESGKKPVSDKVRINIAKYFELDDRFFETMERAKRLAN